jgi:L-ascorbate metabolism protein UlaG (beta-lactamase superfamily)
MRPLPVLAATLLALPLAHSAASPRGATEVTWFGQSTFVVKTPGGTVLVIDPFFGNPKSPDKEAGQKLEKVDYILVSHGHRDHVADAVPLGKRTGAKLVGSSDLGRALVKAGYPEGQAGFETLGNAGGRIEAGDATIIMVPSVHSSDASDDAGHSGGGNPLGFVIKVKGGPTLYHTGDTDVTQDMKLIPERWGPIDVMFACIGGHFTMDPAGAALAAAFVKAKTVVPMHYGTFPVLTGTPEELTKALAGRAKVRVLVPGETVRL